MFGKMGIFGECLGDNSSKYSIELVYAAEAKIGRRVWNIKL